jgi:RNA polymerase sigma-70 factor (ECF subfamily)
MRQGAQVIMSHTASHPRAGAARAEGVEERELIERVRGRELAAFERLYRLYQPRLTRFLSNMVQRPQVLEEVVDDTMMVVWDTAGNFRGASKLSTWIFSIAYRKALKARARWPDPVEEDPRDLAVSEEPAPDDRIQHDRLHDALVAAMDSLSADHRAVVDLTYFHSMGYREIAAIMDCPVDTVKTRMFHARRRLREALGGTSADWL